MGRPVRSGPVTGPVRTARLDLVPLPAAVVAALVEGDLDRAAALAPFPLDASTFADDAYVLGLRHAQLQAEPEQEPWLLHAMVLRGQARTVGRIGFHAPPDEQGSVEVGYTVAGPDRGRGYAVEALGGMLAWARGQGARRCVASIRPDNAASQAVARHFPFVRVGEQIDEIDGLEEVLVLDL